MIKLSDVKTAINRIIINSLVGTSFEGIQPTTADYIKEIPRPSLRVIFDTTRTGKFNSQLRERTLTIRVYFYAEDKNKFRDDNLEMQDIIENAFLEDVKVTDTFYMPITSEDGVTSEVVDTILECYFDLYSLEEIYDDSNLENIEELNINLNYEE